MTINIENEKMDLADIFVLAREESVLLIANGEEFILSRAVMMMAMVAVVPTRGTARMAVATKSAPRKPPVSSHQRAVGMARRSPPGVVSAMTSNTAVPTKTRRRRFRSARSFAPAGR